MDEAAEDAKDFIVRFVESYNAGTRNANPDNPAVVEDYGIEVEPFSRKEMMVMKLKGYEK